MKISKKAQYGLRAVVAIAKESASAKPVAIATLAASEEIPVKFLEQILLSLRKAGLLESKRGAGGGYRLSKPAEQIPLSSIITWIDGPFRPVDRTGSNGLDETFTELENLVESYLSRTTVADVLTRDADNHVLAFDI
ncbi:Rrf2 family transcriptional regulator [Verrucomicrobiales bacterium]|nr:Rrf2 family transcriptional regulator [Verrucomicrobiales bacterium]